MTSTTYHLNYYNLIKVTIFFLVIGNLARSVVKTPSAIIELLLLGALLFFAILYAIQNYTITKTSSLIFFIFLFYLLFHIISASIIRPLTLDISFFTALQFNLLEFRLSIISYFIPLIFMPLSHQNILKLEHFFYLLLKFSIAYTIFEQLTSLLGFRGFYEFIYSNSGIVTENQIGVKSLGMYRIWGLIGSPQLLGVFHIMSLFFMLHKHDKFWAKLSFIAVILSTSKTAYLILIGAGFLYLLYKRKYALLFLSSVLFIFLSIFLFNFYYYLIESHSDNFAAFQKFIGSIIGYGLNIMNVEEVSRPDRFITGGPLYKLLVYYQANPLEIFLGKGLTYSFNDNLITASPLADYLYLTSDFYILTFFDQYGAFGTLLLTFIFFIYPLIKLSIENSYLNFIPIIFFVSMFHYPPQISKLMMIIVALPLWHIYLKKYEKKSR